MDPRPWHRHYDDGVPPDLAFDDITLVERFRRSVAAHPDRPALIFLNRTLTYRQLDDHVRRLAGGLRQLGVEPGARVAIDTPNLPQFVIGYYAALTLGAIAVPTNPLYTSREIAHQWNDAGCDVAIVMDFIYEQRVRAVRDTLPVRQYVIASVPEYLRFPLSVLAPLKLRRQEPALIARVSPAPNVYRFARLVRANPPIGDAAAGGLDDVCTLLYTGGTTGVSKGAALTHRNLTSNVQQLVAWLGEGKSGQDTILAALPFFHSFGLTVVLNVGMALGATLVLIPNPRDIPAIVKSVVKHHITLFPAVPNHFNAINQYPGIERTDLSSIRMCNSGSAPLPVDVLQTFERLTGSTISEGYGLTETSPVTHSNPLRSRKVGSIGVPLPSTDARVVDAEDGTRALPANEVGELAVRGPQVMHGYWRQPGATAEMIRNGWLYTGDLARMDEDGFCFIEGRKKDMILCSGFNVYPDEVDRVLAGHPAVLESATIGVPDPARGETVKAFIVRRAGHDASADDIVAYAREQLAPF